MSDFVKELVLAADRFMHNISISETIAVTYKI